MNKLFNTNKNSMVSSMRRVKVVPTCMRSEKLFQWHFLTVINQILNFCKRGTFILRLRRDAKQKSVILSLLRKSFCDEWKF